MAESATKTPPTDLAAAVKPEAVAASISKLQQEQAAQKQPPLTGVELAERIAEDLPPPPKAGQKYRIAELAKAPAGTPLTPDNSVVISSPDGSIEDAVRAYNAQRGTPQAPIRTAKQLRIEKAA